MSLAKAPVPDSAQKHDKHAPIDITSDTLEVFQAENRAVFSGHVIAIQAEDRLKADVMIVYYRKQEDKTQPDKTAKPVKKASDPAPNPEAGAITKIDTKGNVFLSTPKETASGDYGNYDVDAQLIHLNDHVVLTRGPNVLKGDHLVYNLSTGKSVVTSEASDSKTPSAPGTSKQRVHALFIPEKNDKPKKPDTPTPAPVPTPPVTPPQPPAEPEE